MQARRIAEGKRMVEREINIETEIFIHFSPSKFNTTYNFIIKSLIYSISKVFGKNLFRLPSYEKLGQT